MSNQIPENRLPAQVPLHVVLSRVYASLKAKGLA